MGLRTHSELRVEEYRRTSERLLDILDGAGPRGAFDADHLKAIHKYLFDDVYEWAGRTRNERPVVDGFPVEPIGAMSKNGNAFLHGSRIEMGLTEALRPIANPDVLRGSTAEQFADVAGRVLAELNYVHPFREGNGRTQEAFISELGRQFGHDVDLSVITKARMINASIAVAADPSHPAMRQLLADATIPARAEALRDVLTELRAAGVETRDYPIRTGRPSETLSGDILTTGPQVVSIVTPSGVFVVPAKDVPAPKPGTDTVLMTVRSTFESLAQAKVEQQRSGYWTGLAAKASSSAATSPPTETETARPRPKLKP
ncbi:Fic family protein [Endobacter medicaginis]|nr:Fic family protein [Endobacter medicaginis]NVN30731.1 Fic family protein [Endobacter medicaginis]